MRLTAHRSKNAVALACCMLALLGGACSSSDQTTVPVEQFPTQFGNALCDSIAPCCLSASIAYDSATCKASATGFFQDYLSASSSPHTTYDPAAAGRCLDAVKASLQACKGLDDSTTGAACADIIVGNVPVGGVCTTNPECANQARCVPDVANPANAHCVALDPAQVHGKAGQACNGSCVTVGAESDCFTAPSTGNSPPAAVCYSSDGLHCSSQTQVCIALGQIGQACEPQGCAAGAFCDAGTCASTRDSGPCLTAPDACSTKSFCDPTGQCTPKKADGAACEQSSDCASDICAQGSSGAGVCGSNAVTPALCAGNLK